MLELLFMVVFALADLKVGVLTSSTTSADYISELHHSLWSLSGYLESSLSLTFKVTLEWATVSVVDQESSWSIPFALSDSQVLIDATNSLAYGQFLASSAASDGFLHCVAGRSINSHIGENPGSSSLYIERSTESEAIAFMDLIAHFNWTKLGLIYDDKNENKNLSQFLKNNYTDGQIRDEVLLSRDDLDLSETLASRFESTTKISDARSFVVMTEPTLAAIALYAADRSSLGNSGHAWLLNTQAMKNIGEVARSSHADEIFELFGVLKTGAIGFMTDEDNSPLASIKNTLVLIAQAYAQLGINASIASIRNEVLSNSFNGLRFDASGVKYTQYELYNIQDFATVKVGYHDLQNRNIVLNSDNVIWPGFDTSPPNDLVSVLKLVLLYPLHDENGLEFPEGANIRQGFDFAIESINNDPNLLPGYIIEPVYRDTYRSKSLVSATFKSLANVDVLGYVGPFDSEICREYLDYMNTRPNPKPMVSYGASAYYLQAKDYYPYFLRMIQDDGSEGKGLTRFIQQEIISKIGVIYTNDTYGIGVYESLVANGKAGVIEILNDEDKRAISYDGTIDENTRADIDTVLSNLVEKKAKIIIYMGSSLVSPEVAKAAYKKELYGPDYGWMGNIWITEETLALIEGEYAESKEEIYEVLKGAVSMDFAPPLTDFGAQFAIDYQKRWNANYTIYSMYAYDAVYLFATITDDMIARGENFNDVTELNAKLRGADFDVASGKVNFVDGVNNRESYGYSVMNFISRKLTLMLTYNTLDKENFILGPKTPVQWYGDTKPTDEWPEEDQIDCPFASHMRRISEEGLALIIGIGVFLFAFTLLLSYFSYRKWKQISIKIIDEDVLRSWKDSLVLITIVIEFFQFIAIAPRFLSLELSIEIASNVFMLDIIKIVQGDKSSYWNLLIAICILCYVWFAVVVLIMLNVENWVKEVPVCQRFFTLFNSAYLPFIGNTMFLPFTALLLDCFVCDYQAQGKSLVRRDCYMNCWTEEHIPFVIMATVALAVYLPIAVLSRPMWQQARSGLNLKAKPSYLLFKTCMQILMIVIGKSLRGVAPIGHGVIFSLLSVAFAVQTYKSRPFNYERCNLYEVSSLGAVAYLSLLATISFEVEPTHYAWFIVLCIGWAFILGITYLIQRRGDKYKQLLKTPGIQKNKVKIQSMITFTNQSKRFRDESCAFEFYGKNPSPVELSVSEFDDSQDSVFPWAPREFEHNSEERKDSES